MNRRIVFVDRPLGTDIDPVEWTLWGRVEADKSVSILHTVQSLMGCKDVQGFSVTFLDGTTLTFADEAEVLP